MQLAARPYIPYDRDWEVAYDRWQERLVRAALWAAAREPQARLEIAAPETVDRPALPVNVAIRWEAAPAGSGWTARLRRRDGALVALGAGDCGGPAEATIDGDRIVVRSREVAEPVAVRYGWTNDLRCNLFNRAGLPASPFRTDSWDLPVTYPHRSAYRPHRHAEMRIPRRKGPMTQDSPEKNDPARQSRISHLTLWYSTEDKKPCCVVTYGLNHRAPQVSPPGVEGAFAADGEGAGYALEYKIPLTVLHAARGLKSGDTIQPQFHVLWGRDDGRSCRFSVTDFTDPKGFNPAGEWDRAYHGPLGSVVATCE